MKRIIFLSLIPLFLVNNVFANNQKEHIDINAVWSAANYGGPFCYSLRIIYYPNGQIKQQGCQGHYNATGISVGNWYEYDLLGMPVRTNYYHPDEFGKDYKIITTYDKNGKVLTKKIYNYDDLYETEEEELNEIPQ
ncbi:hypothetical protein ACFX2V_10550 [Gilliamella apicola]|uniref:hypothetical protein n=1 Tax=Gilliamella apicola TaxID=1196095 RepID=UPI003987B2A0